MDKKIISLEKTKSGSIVKRIKRRRIIRKVIYTVLVSLSLVIGVSMIVLYNMGDRIFDEVIKAQLIAEQQADKPASVISDEQGKDKDSKVSADHKNSEGSSSKAQGNNNNPVADENEEDEGNSIEDKSDTEVKSNPEVAEEPDSAEKPASQGSNETKSNDAGDTAEKTAGNGKSEKVGDTVSEKKNETDEEYIEPAKIQEISSKVTAQDKMKAAALVLKRLTAADRKELEDMLPGGVTEAEKERAKEIAYSKFTSEELKEIFELYDKYVNTNNR